MNVYARDSRRFKHVFLDAEGTLYIPHRGRSTWEFWADPSPGHAKDFFVLDEGVAEALRSLRERVDSLCIVSRNSKPILDALLDDFGIRDYFDEVILNGNKGKQILKYLARRGYERRDAVMVGDTPVLDLYPVKKAGIEAILVDRPYNRMADAERIKGVRELPSWLRIADIAERGAVPRNSTLDDFVEAPPARTGRLISATGC
jgi:FMN phosphatase YigB (HAD superfamily)